MTELLVMGGGKMGEALLTGIFGSGAVTPEGTTVVEVSSARRSELAERFPGVTVVEAPVAAGAAVIAVKPHDVEAACAAIGAAGAGRVLSIAAGVLIAQLESWLPAGTPVIRAMPNTPSLVGAGAAAVAGGTSAGEEDMAWAETILGAVGLVKRVPEKLLDAVTGLSGSGPAYIFLVAEALIDAGVLVGLPRDISRDLTVQTMLGAARMLAESGNSAEELRAAVTSPGGTTAAAISALEARAVRSAFTEAVVAAAERSRELGNSSH
jgi:pyrroline-5-carboxylate reductase